MEKKSALTPQYGRFLIWLKRPFPDFDFSFIKPVRRWTVELLDLKPGDRVRDVGCRPGGSFRGGRGRRATPSRVFTSSLRTSAVLLVSAVYLLLRFFDRRVAEDGFALKVLYIGSAA